MSIFTDPAAAGLAEEQYGVITRQQLLALACSASAIDRALRTGVLQRLHRGVFRVAGAPITAHQAALAAVLSAGPSARLSGHAALALLHVRGIPPAPHPFILVPTSRRTSGRAFARHRDLAPNAHHATIGAIPATTPARALVEAATTWRRRRLLDVLDRLRWDSATGSRDVIAAAQVLGPRHPGARLVRSLHADGELDQDSGGERSLGDVLTDIGLIHRVRWQVWLDPSLRVDCLIDDRLVLEYDGALAHDGVQRAARDTRRDARIVELGHQVLHVRRADLARPAKLRAEILRLLADDHPERAA